MKRFVPLLITLRALGCAALCLAATATQLYGDTFDPSRYYHFQTQSTGRFLATGGNPCRVQYGGQEINESWNLQSAGNNNYYLVNQSDPTKVLAASTTNQGTNGPMYAAGLQNRSQNANSHQQWSITGPAGGPYQIANAAYPTLVLAADNEIPPGSMPNPQDDEDYYLGETSYGLAYVQTPTTGDPTQQWYIAAVATQANQQILMPLLGWTPNERKIALYSSNTPVSPAPNFTVMDSSNHQVLSQPMTPWGSTGYNLGFYQFALLPVAAEYEGESLSKLTVAPSSTQFTLQPDPGASHCNYEQIDFGAGSGYAGYGYVQYQVSVTVPGTYDIRVATVKTPTSGQWQLKINGVQVGGTIDDYTPGSAVHRVVDLGNISLPSGTQVVEFDLVGNDSASSGYQLCFDALYLAQVSNDYEAESQMTTITGTGASHQSMPDTYCSGGAFDYAQFNNTGQSVEYTLSVPQAGTYSIQVKDRMESDMGIWQLSVDGVNLGSAVDGYSSAATYSVNNLGAVTLTAGNHQISFAISGRNSLSTGYATGIDEISLVAVPLTYLPGSCPTTPGSGVSHLITNDPNCPDQQYDAVTCSASGQSIAYQISVPTPGFYFVSVGNLRGPDKGKWQVGVADQTGNLPGFGPVIDSFAAQTAYPNTSGWVGNIPASGSYTISFTVTGQTNTLWNQNYFSADLSSLTTPGTYTVSAGSATSSFRIATVAYRDLPGASAGTTLDYTDMFAGFWAHEAAYSQTIDNALIQPPVQGSAVSTQPQWTPAGGSTLIPALGWFDANSRDSKTARDAMTLTEMCLGVLSTTQKGDQNTLIDKIANQGVERLLSTQNGNGSWPVGKFRNAFPNLDKYDWSVDVSTGATAKAVRALALASQVLQAQCPGVASQALTAAENGWTYVAANQGASSYLLDRLDPSYSGATVDILSAAVELARSNTGSSQYSTAAEQLIGAGHYVGSAWKGINAPLPAEYGDDTPYLSVVSLCRYYPIGSAQAQAEILADVTAWTNNWDPAFALGPYPVAALMGTYGNSNQIADLAESYLQIYQTFKPAGLFAEALPNAMGATEWITGLNPYGCTLISGVAGLAPGFMFSASLPESIGALLPGIVYIAPGSNTLDFTFDQYQSTESVIQSSAALFDVLSTADALLDAPIPAPPSGLAAAVVSGPQVNLTWSASSGATSYNLQRADAVSGPYAPIATVTGTSYSDTSVMSGHIYYYEVSALSGTDESVNSAPVATPYEAEVLPRAPSQSRSDNVTSDASCSAGAFDLGNLTGAGQFMQYTVTVGTAGTYAVYVKYKGYSDGGIWQLWIDGTAQGTTVDGYSAGNTYSEASLQSVTLSAGTHVFRFTITGHNSSSSGFKTRIDAILLAPVQ